MNCNGTRNCITSSRSRGKHGFFPFKSVPKSRFFVVKSVIIILIAASIYSWALIFDKYKLFKNLNKSILDFENKFWKAKSAESFDNNLPVKSNDPAILIFRSAMNELRKTRSKSSAVQLARVERVLEINTDNQIKIIEKNFNFLATVGATAPFIGLFGTVWGYNEFFPINSNF